MQKVNVFVLLHLRKEKAKHYQDLEIEYNQNQVKQRDLQRTAISKTRRLFLFKKCISESHL